MRDAVIIASLFAILAPVVLGESPLQGADAARETSPQLGVIRGRVVDSSSGQVIAHGSVTIRTIRDSAFAGGALVGSDGSFRVDAVIPGEYVVSVRAIGFAPAERSPVVLTRAAAAVDLGDVRLKALPVQLAPQTVTGVRSDVNFAPDRNSYSMKGIPAASGGTVVDALRTLPAVSIDPSDRIALRGNYNVVVQINGRPSPLRGEQLGAFLTPLPASAVSRIEVATNPSAKEDPEGTAGIINIVLDSSVQRKLSGGLTAATGTTGMGSFAGNVGQQQGPLSLFSSLSFFRDNREFRGYSDRHYKTRADSAATVDDFLGRNRPLFATWVGRSEYKLSAQDALTGDVLLSGGRMARDVSGRYQRFPPDSAPLMASATSEQLTRSLTQDYVVGHRHDASGHGLSVVTEVRWSESASRFHNALSNVALRDGAPVPDSAAVPEWDLTTARQPVLTVSSDGTWQRGEKTKLEFGVKATDRRSSSDFASAAAAASATAPGVISDAAQFFRYHERIGAAYTLVSERLGKVDAQEGLRAERTLTGLDDSEHLAEHTTAYTSVFPSAVLAYTSPHSDEVRLSYSRRIWRPTALQLSSAQFRDDPRALFRGNPGLRPEYSDELELQFQHSAKWGIVQVAPYYERTSQAVRLVRLVDTTGHSVTTFANFAHTVSAGAGFTLNLRHGPLTSLLGGEIYEYSSTSSADAIRSVATSLRGSLDWRQTSTTTLQLLVNYMTPTTTEGGAQRAYIFTNVAVRRSLWAGRGSVIVRATDPFNLTTIAYVTEDAQVREYSRRGAGFRGIFITFTRAFGEPLKLRPRPPEPEPAPIPQPGGA